jgi:hypothetical protein
MKFRVITSLLLAAVLVALYLWQTDSDTQQPAPISAPAPTTDQGTPPGLGRLKIF